MDADVPARPAGRVAAMVSRAVSRRWAFPPARNRVIVARDVPVPMADGAVLRADHYVPVTGRAAATILIRTPYGRGGPERPELMSADYRIGVLGESTLVLPVVTAAGKPSPAGPLARSAAPGHV